MKDGFIRERIKALPLTPGVYFFKNREGECIYIGKALSIKKRVTSHFRGSSSFSKQGHMIAETASIHYVETPTEAEALLLEASLVKENQPKYNQELKDDKSYPFLKITDEEFPRLLVVRGRKTDGGKYYGPYTSGKLLRQAVRMLRRLFPMRTCHPMPDKVCLMYHIGQCKGPCVGEIGKTAYLAMVKELQDFLDGRRDALVKNLSRRMKEYSEKREYEKAKVAYEEIRAIASLPLEKGMKKKAASALGDLKEALGLPAFPSRIEGFDISNMSGKEAVGSMVVFIDGKPARSDYRRFRIKTVQGIDDYEMMREVVRRRYARVLEEKIHPPDLVVIDGGKGHLAAAKKELDALNLQNLPIISIAKQHEHLFKPGREQPYVFSQSSPMLNLIRHLRDEAHRFAITYHRRLHKKAALLSELDKIPGVGPKTRDRLLKKFGSVSKIKNLSERELVEAGGLSPRVALGLLQGLKHD